MSLALNSSLDGRDAFSGRPGPDPAGNESIALREAAENDLDVDTDVYSKVVVTLIYIGLFVLGSLGNFITIYTLMKKNTLQHLQGTVNYHLANLALSDLLILLLCMPIELYNFIWVHHPWAFGDAVCRGYYFLRDACTYATALNISSLSAERYMAICHPFKAKTLMSSSRTKKLISLIWLLSFLLATPMLFTMGEKYANPVPDPDELICTTIVDEVTVKTVIQVNAFLSFVIPMVMISVFNTIIANQLIAILKHAAPESGVCIVEGQQNTLSIVVEPSRIQSLRHGVKVLRAVVIAFVVCWLPYHIRRLMFCYVPKHHWTEFLYDFYHYFYMVTNILFYVSSAINPILYNLVSANFRQNFFSTLSSYCLHRQPKPKTRAISRKSNSISSNHTYSNVLTKETMY
ncbi:neurotensin receptor type 1 [Leucoraja erinacea]|uniref:neurotensin receptor type 1 n=1 Tax=Leucoraja erinaceus TaxID=7782 RepID=UPI0024550732|nr:neurotensin receptor type 1 [Leucoraja erinacea]